MDAKILVAIEELAGLQFTAEEVAVMVGLPLSAFEENASSAAIAFLKGRLMAQAEVRRSVLQMAKQGSSPAQKQFAAMAEESAIDFETTEEV